MPSSNINTTGVKVVAQPLIAALYARVSTTDQEEQETIKTQLDDLYERIKEDGNILSPDNEYKDDGWTGTILERPALDAMRDAAEGGKFQILYVYDRGRIARRYLYQEMVLEELEKVGIRFVTLHDRAILNDEDRLMQGFQGLFAEWERTKILERTRRGRLRKAKEGILMSGQPLYGYTRVPKTETTPAHWIINEDEARMARQMFDWVGKEIRSLYDVQQKLYELGILPKKRRDLWWSKGSILRLLKNETYITGIHYYNTTEAVPAKKPIVTPH